MDEVPADVESFLSEVAEQAQSRVLKHYHESSPRLQSHSDVSVAAIAKQLAGHDIPYETVKGVRVQDTEGFLKTDFRPGDEIPMYEVPVCEWGEWFWWIEVDMGRETWVIDACLPTVDGVKAKVQRAPPEDRVYVEGVDATPDVGMFL